MPAAAYTPPDAQSTSLALTQATSAEVLALIKQDSVIWRGSLSIEAYVRREDHLSAQPATGNGSMTRWVLVDSTMDPEHRVVLAGCYSIRRHALVFRNGRVEDVVAHAIGSVFSPPEYRGKGFGARMMFELGARLETWQTESLPCLFTILHSDIGKKFYANLGWKPYPSAHVHLPSRQEDLSKATTHTAVKPLYASDLHDLCTRDEALIRNKLAHSHGQPRIALLADLPTISWHHAREEFVANELYGETPLVKGAITTVGDHRIWCIWTRTWYNQDPQQSKGNTLHVIRLVIEDETLDQANGTPSGAQVDAIAALLRIAQAEAHMWKQDEVELWNPHPRSVLAARKLHPATEVHDRDFESISSLRWYGSTDEGNVDWMENEKYAWC